MREPTVNGVGNDIFSDNERHGSPIDEPSFGKSASGIVDEVNLNAGNSGGGQSLAGKRDWCAVGSDGTLNEDGASCRDVITPNVLSVSCVLSDASPSYAEHAVGLVVRNSMEDDMNDSEGGLCGRGSSRESNIKGPLVERGGHAEDSDPFQPDTTPRVIRGVTVNESSPTPSPYSLCDAMMIVSVVSDDVTLEKLHEECRDITPNRVLKSDVTSDGITVPFVQFIPSVLPCAIGYQYLSR